MSVLADSQSLLDQPGTVAFLVIFGMGVMLFFVFRSMSKHLRKVNMAARAEAEAAARAEAGDEAAEAGLPPATPGQTRRT
jgi:hypothetical protein